MRKNLYTASSVLLQILGVIGYFFSAGYSMFFLIFRICRMIDAEAFSFVGAAKIVFTAFIISSIGSLVSTAIYSFGKILDE